MAPTLAHTRPWAPHPQAAPVTEREGDGEGVPASAANDVVAAAFLHA